MPLLDHFHPPLSQHRQWESFHSAWAEALAWRLNRGLLPARYFAEVHVKVGSRVEIDVGTFQGNGAAGASDGGGGVAVWSPPRPVLDQPLTFTHPDVFEVQVLNDAQGPHVVAAIELVSPANKDRASAPAACSPSSAPVTSSRTSDCSSWTSSPSARETFTRTCSA